MFVPFVHILRVILKLKKIIIKIFKKHLHFFKKCGNILEHLISSVSLPMGLMPF